ILHSSCYCAGRSHTGERIEFRFCFVQLLLVARDPSWIGIGVGNARLQECNGPAQRHQFITNGTHAEVVGASYWIVSAESVEIYSTCFLDRVTVDKSAVFRVIEATAVIHEPSLHVRKFSGKSKWLIRNRAIVGLRAQRLAKRRILVG